ncbi:hypothetical protein Tco_1334527 [Tanacetum coccineum]
MDAQITVDVVLHDGEMLPIQKATIVSYLREWKPTLSLVAFDDAVGYLPHLRRNGEVVAGILACFLMEDEREESIQEGLDLLIVLANTRPDLLMDDDLYECLMGITGKENVEGETVSKATDFVLILAERGERSNDDLGPREENGPMMIWELDLGNSLRSASWEQRRPVMATYDAIIEGCTTDEIMSFVGSKRVLGITLVYLKDKDPRVKVAASKLIRTLFLNSLQLYVQFKVEVHQKINEMMEVAAKVEVHQKINEMVDTRSRSAGGCCEGTEHVQEVGAIRKRKKTPFILILFCNFNLYTEEQVRDD